MANTPWIDDNTLFLAHCNGADGGTTFTDSSPKGFTITANGNAQTDTAQYKFGGSSLLCDGTGDYITCPDNACWDFGTGDFTLECWVRWNTVADCGIMSVGDCQSGAGVGLQLFSNNIYVKVNTASAISYVWTPGANTWYHLATTRASGTLYLFIDGILVDDVANTTNITSLTSGVYAGRANNWTSDLNGWLNEVKVSNVARYTADFTPLARPYMHPPGIHVK